MIVQGLLQPRHVVPGPVLPTHPLKHTHHLKSQCVMKTQARVVGNSHPREGLAVPTFGHAIEQCAVQPSAGPRSSTTHLEVDTGLTRPPVRRPGGPRMRVRVTHHTEVILGDEPHVF